MEVLLVGVHRTEDHLVAHDHVVSDGAQLVEGLYVEPGALIAIGVQVDPHRVLLQQRRQPLVDRQILVGLQMQELHHSPSILD